MNHYIGTSSWLNEGRGIRREAIWRNELKDEYNYHWNVFFVASVDGNQKKGDMEE